MYDDEDIDVASAIMSLARRISPDGLPGHDAAGGTVDSLTEAVMGITAGLYAIAEAIRDRTEAGAVNSDAIPELLYPAPNKPDRYVVISTNLETHSFADALAVAEKFCRSEKHHDSWGIYRLDSTVELINGIISVRAES